MKKCAKCKDEKSLDSFCKDSRAKSKLYFWCKSCVKEYKIKNKKSIVIQGKKYYINNKEKIKDYCLKNKEKIIKRCREYNKQERGRERDKKYKLNNRDKIRKYEKNRYKTDIQFKLAKSLRNRLWDALKGNYKSGSAVRDLGCTIEQFKDWLERQFEPGMDWNNYGSKEGQWSIDHEYPLSEVDLTKRELLLTVIHYTNLQPMWHVDNLKKGNH